MAANCGTIIVEAQSSFDRDAVEATACTLGSSSVNTGEDFTISLEVTNNNDAAATTTAKLFIDDGGTNFSNEELAQESTTVPGNDTVTFSYTASVNVDGTFTITGEVTFVQEEGA